MTQEDVLHRYRLGTMALAERLGNVRQACQILGIHPSTYYRWRGDFERYGPEALRPRERRHPRMPNATPALVEQRVVAFALAHLLNRYPSSRGGLNEVVSESAWVAVVAEGGKGPDAYAAALEQIVEILDEFV